MTQSTEELLSKATDKFQFVLEYRELYGSAIEYEKGISFLERVAARCVSISDKVNIELGVTFMKRTRSPESLESLLDRLAAISETAQRVSGFSTRIEVVRSAIKLLRSHDLVKTHLQLEGLYSQLKTSHDQLAFGLVAWYLGISCMWSKDEKSSEDAFHDALSAFRRFDYKIIHAFALSDYGVLKKRVCQYGEAKRILQQALVQFSTLDLQRGVFATSNNLAVVCVRTGDWRAAVYYFEAADNVLKTLVSAGSDKNTYLSCVFGTNYNHLLILQREFDAAESHFQKTLGAYDERKDNQRLSILAREFLGELYTEIGQYARARNLLESAYESVSRHLPDSDVSTEVTRRLANVCLQDGDLSRSKKVAIECVRVCKKIGDKYELGAGLRILGETFAELGNKSKAVSCFESSVRILKSINECYELMRTCISYGSYLIGDNLVDAELYLIEARHLSTKLDLDYFMARISTEFARLETEKLNYIDARTRLAEAEKISENLRISDKRELKPLIERANRGLEQRILKASVSGAEKLKVICRVYEEARFPMEELKPDLAYQVAQSVDAESLFLIKRKGRGFSVPLAYNIAVEEAKETVRRLDRDTERPILGLAKDPRIYRTHTGHSLVCVSTQGHSGYALCTRITADRSFSPRQFEFLIASADAIERLAGGDDEKPTGVGDDFLHGGSGVAITHPRGSFKDILTVTPDMIKLIRLAERASLSEETILLEGETGVGKELFANAIHARGHRSNRHFVAINAGGLPVNLIESQLFGHVKGAFTDAVKDRTGLIEDANGGTVFFDEVGEMGPELQVKLLRLLENGEYRRLGENEVRIANVRVVSATNRDLLKEVEKGTFRRDLYYRLGTVRLHIPPLRFRQRDIELLVRHFLKQCALRNGQPDRYFEIDVKAMEAMELYDWPGNARELQNEIRRIVSLIGDNDVIRFGMLSLPIKEYLKSKNRSEGLLERSVERYERRLILEALNKNDWNRLRTAEELGLPRTTLLAKMRRLNVAAH